MVTARDKTETETKRLHPASGSPFRDECCPTEIMEGAELEQRRRGGQGHTPEEIHLKLAAALITSTARER